jgi:hypothetical protein
LGEHTEEVLRDLAGLTPAQLAEALPLDRKLVPQGVV